METLLEVFEKWRVLLDKHSTEFHIFVGILMLLTVIFVVGDWIMQKNPYCIVLVGPQGSGKTMLYKQLKYGSSYVGTVEPNGGTFMLNTSKGKRKIVDVPRREVIKYLPVTAGLVFVVDSTAFLPRCAEISEYVTYFNVFRSSLCKKRKQEIKSTKLTYMMCKMYLYDLLRKLSILRKRIPVLILFNKMDAPIDHSMEFTRKQIEREIDRILVSREVVGQASSDYKTFNFSRCLNKVKFAESSGLKGEIFELEKFIREC